MSAYSDAVLGDSPLGFWELQETTGTTAADAEGASPGTYGGTGFALGAAGPLTQTSVAFDNTAGTGWVNVANTAAVRLAAASTLSMEFLVKAKSGGPGTFKYLMDMYNDSLGIGFFVQTGGSGGLKIGLGNGVPVTYEIGPTYAWDTAWHHLVTTWDILGSAGTSRATIYDQGAAIFGPNAAGVLVANGTNLTDPLRIADYSLGGLEFPGEFAFAALYGYALTAAQVASHFAAISAAGPSVGEWAGAVPLG